MIKIIKKSPMTYCYDKQNIFARILRKEIPGDIVFETKHSVILLDINPAAPIHWLVLSKGSYVNFSHFITQASDDEILDFNQAIGTAVARLRRDFNIINGYRIISNSGLDGGQEIAHLHVHILAGRPLGALLTKI